MNEGIRVYVVDRGRASLYMRYSDPLTGRAVERSTGMAKRKDAEREAAKWEAELREGRYKSPSRVTWEEFRERYENDALPSLAASTASKAWTVLNSVENAVSPNRLADLSADRIGKWQQSLREAGRSEATIKSYTAHLKASLNWAHDVGMLPTVPKIRMPHRAKNQKVMRGRPITGEEFDRMIASVPKVVGDRRAESWEFLLRGLWWSGLRITEALALTWDGDGLTVDLSGKHPMLRIPAESEKGNRDRVLPVAPEAAELLLSVPPTARSGYVFKPSHKWQGRPRATRAAVIRGIVRIGRRAGVKVGSHPSGDPRYASAHDLRRSFGERWAQRVMPPLLQQLMRHESIETTMRFYVGRDAEATADLLYAAVSGDTFGDTGRGSWIPESGQSTQPVGT